MADHKTEKYHRINLFLDKGFIRLAREVVQKHVVNSTPPCHNPNPWRLEDFLFQNQRAIFRYPNGKPRNLLEGQKQLLIPTPPDKPNLEHWDITLLCFVLTELCPISKPDKDDIIVIQKIRNEICHTTDASLSDREYADYSNAIKSVIGRFLVWLNDANITQEINDIIKDIEDGPLTHLQELLRQVEKWQSSERGLATAVNNLSLVTTTGFAEQDKKYDKLMEKMQTIIDQNGRNLQPPDTKINMRVINCENEDYLCDKLVAILKSENQTDDQLERPLKNAMSKLIKEEMKIISVKKECVAIVLRCRSFESLHSLWTTCVNGEATQLFKPVEQCLRDLPGCESVELKVGVTEKELLRCVEIMVSEIEEDTVRQEPTCTATVMHSLQEKDLHSLPKSESTTLALQQSVEPGPQHGKEGIVIKIVIKPTKFEQVKHALDSFESTEFTKDLQSISLMLQENLKIADVDVKATLENETELKEALVSNLHMLKFGAALQSTKSSEYCLIHDVELMNMFCHKHQIIGCHQCIEQDDGSCEGVIPKAMLQTETSNMLFLSEFQSGSSLDTHDINCHGHGHGPMINLKQKNWEVGSAQLKGRRSLTGDDQVPGSGNQHPVLYTVGRSREVKVRHQSDKQECSIGDMCLLSDGRILMADYNNDKLKLLDSNLNVIHQCDVQYTSRGVCMVTDTEAAVAMAGKHIQLVSIEDNIKIGRRIQLDHGCGGLVYSNGELYVSNGYTSIHVYTVEGQKMRIIRSGLNDDPSWNFEWLTVSNDGSRIYMTNWDHGIVCLYRLSGEVIWKVKDTENNVYSGVCVDRYNNVLVCRSGKDDVVQFSPGGQMTRVVINESEGIQDPNSICIDEVRGKLIVGMWANDVVKVFDLKQK